MGGHIDCYLDCASLYSYFTLVYLLKHKEILASHDVTVDINPIFLGGVNVGSGNKPPWSLPAKAKYGAFDSARAKKYHDLPKIEPPDFFPPLTLLPQRALTFVKATYPSDVFEKTYLAIFHDLWTPPQSDITIPANLAKTLQSTGLYSDDQIAKILQKATDKHWKDKLLENTKLVLEQGAFGAPWFWVRNAEGKEEPFFGSDRFHFIWDFLGLPWQDIQLLPKGAAKGRHSKL